MKQYYNIAEKELYMKNCINKKAFTLAEVLITLVIIGVIAAITVPIVISSAEEQGKSARVKKTYAAIANALTRVKSDGTDMDFNFSGSYSNQAEINNWYRLYLFPYLVTQKVCYDTKGCWNSGDTKNKNGGNVYLNRTGVGIGNGIVTAILNDGTFVNFNIWSKASMKTYFGVDIKTDAGLAVYFDINGDKEPNTLGKDVFCAAWTDGGFVPAYTNNAANIKSNCNTGTGYSCINNYLRQ